ncbi:MAG: YceI family protein [Methylococcales bacterium]|nr:YceI family protein [Methylococcales bacterium]MDD5753592.1 YceI family protein [Methylococcales bacterium]
MKHIALLVFTSAISASVFAAPETYTIDNNHTYPRFSYNHLGYSTQLSRFDKTTGSITIDRAVKTGVVDVTIDTTSVNTGSPLFDQHIQGADFLDTTKYPTATFISSKVNFNDDNVASVDGTLTLKGISKPVSLVITSFQCMFHPMLLKSACGANATTVVKRTDFNMGKYAPLVGDDVTITLSVEAVKE